MLIRPARERAICDLLIACLKSAPSDSCAVYIVVGLWFILQRRKIIAFVLLCTPRTVRTWLRRLRCKLTWWEYTHRREAFEITFKFKRINYTAHALQNTVRQAERAGVSLMYANCILRSAYKRYIGILSERDDRRSEDVDDDEATMMLNY